MAEGGMAAAMANNDDRDSWKVHFADTMRGGQYVNNWRMAEIHAKEAPDRVRELEGVGRRVRPHARRPHQPAQLRRPPLPAAGARRRPHRPRADSHAAGPRHPLRHDRAHGAHRHRPAARRRARGGLRGLRPRARPLPRVRGQGGGAGDRRRGPRLQDHQQQLGRHRRRARAGVSGRRRAHRHGVHPVPSDRHGVAAERARHPRDRRRARRRRRAEEQRRPPLHVRRHPRQLQAADGRRTPKKAGATRRTTRARAVRRSC